MTVDRISTNRLSLVARGRRKIRYRTCAPSALADGNMTSFMEESSDESFEMVSRIWIVSRAKPAAGSERGAG